MGVSENIKNLKRGKTKPMPVRRDIQEKHSKKYDVLMMYLFWISDVLNYVLIAHSNS